VSPSQILILKETVTRININCAFCRRDNRDWKKEKAKPVFCYKLYDYDDVGSEKVDLLADASWGHESTSLSFRQFETQNFWL